MLLDIWFSSDGSHVILDEDEVEQCLRSGRLTAKDKEYVEESKRAAIRDFAENAEKVRGLTSLLDIPRERASNA